MNVRARLSVLVAVSTVLVAASAAPALAHVTVNPKTAQKGGYAELVFRAPNEEDKANTTKVQVFFPIDHPLASVSVQPTPGWVAKVVKTKLAKPIQSDDGDVTEAVSSITWTGNLKPGEYQNLAVSVGPLPDDTGQMVFKALQTYSNGDVVRWIELPSGGKEPEHPAPILTLTDAPKATATGSSSAASATATGAPAALAAAPVAATSATSSGSSDGLARGLGIAALLLGLIALVVALVRSRRTPGSTPTS